jgi:hypothetical protein
LNGLNKH